MRFNSSQLLILGLIILADGHALARGGNQGTVCGQPGGADIICGEINAVSNFAAEQIGGVWYDAFSFGQIQCNVGDTNLPYVSFPSNRHPALAPNLFKLKDDRFEQIGMGWLAHTFLALQQNSCGCGGCTMGGAVLGIGCASPDTSAWAGTQVDLGPRWQVNAHSGFFPTGEPANPSFSGTTARRVRVKSADLELSSASVKYFVEYNFISANDALLGHNNNNASYRPLTITGGPDNFNAAIAGTLTAREQAAIRAWRANDPSVVETEIQIPNEGLFILAAKATDRGNGQWHYEYALENVNSDLSVQAFRVPLSLGIAVSNIGFHDVDYHSGDAQDNFTDGSLNFSNVDWSGVIDQADIRWSTQTYAENVNANALRWGTMYNFRFDCDRPPAPRMGSVTLETFKSPGSITAFSIVPHAVCAADVAPTRGDDTVDIDDLVVVITHWGACADPCTPGPGAPNTCIGDINRNCVVDIDDLVGVITAWGVCPVMLNK